MKLEMAGREPYIVLFGIPLITVAIVIGSYYIGRMQSELIAPPPIYVEPKLTVSPRITAEIPQGAIQADVRVPPAQIHEIVKEVVRIPEVNVVNRIEPTPVQVSIPSAPSQTAGNELRFIVVPAPLPLPITAASSPLMTGPALPSKADLADQPITPPKPVQPTPVSTDATSPLPERDVDGKLLPPPQNIGGQPEPR